MSHHPLLLSKKQSALVIVDVQEKINAVMFSGKLVKSNITRLIAACKVLQVPILYTEQYPQGLGPTEPNILVELETAVKFTKMSFSCCGAEGFLRKLKEFGTQQVILTGIECHVCVLQTALDLIHEGMQVHLVNDAVSSRKQLDYKVAQKRMAEAGVIVTTTESVLFELVEDSGAPEFKKVAKLIK